MRISILAFLAAAFLLLWLNSGDLAPEDRNSIGTITPTITRIIESAPIAFAEPPLPSPLKRPPPVEVLTTERWLLEESVRIGQVDPNPDQTMIRLKDKASRLNSQDLKFLKRSALDKNLSGDARFLAVYMLGLAEAGGAVALLKEVCFAKIPDMASDREHSNEVVLRAQSLETLVQRMPPREARVMLRELLSRTSDPILARQAQYWLSKLS